MAEPRLLMNTRLGPGTSLALDEGQGRYVAGVLRLAAGAPVRVFNGRDGEWQAVIAAAGKRAVHLTITKQVRLPQALAPLILLFAPLKRQATDLVVEKATELGVTALIPVLTRRTVAETVRIERLGAIAREAAEQCERLDAPTIAPARPLAHALSDWPPQTPILLAAERAGAPTVAAALADGPHLAIAVMIGPEGGFDPAELALLTALPMVRPISLGPLILRAETAAIAALALAQAARGDT